MEREQGGLQDRNQERQELNRILRELGHQELVTQLAEGLSGADFNTLMLELFRRRAADKQPSELLRSYRENRFVKPAVVDSLALKQLELDLLLIARERGYAPMQLSPVAPLGSCSVVAHADQNKVISALRGTEVVGDMTNLLALHIADGVQSGALNNHPDPVRLCTTHRLVRAQKFPDLPGYLSHFSAYAMVTAGRDRGSYTFEKEAVWEHIAMYRDMFSKQFRGTGIEVLISGRGGYTDGEGLIERTVQHLHERAPELVVTVVPPKDNAYYLGLQFTIKTTIDGREHFIGDGGFVDWTRQLLGSKKERMLISAIGLDRLLM
ncbi:hypothetical protein [Paenibacillus sp. OV219]|uniref:hypothetical protein n=1 Tax=Paenibacillus sp. OV219 TaxID=1884377 RepID=UPI0008D49FAA|nr:hypothetical protein [Paenibacillus sp. OV219]SEO74975.1 hypothetical protein SAMN05518847_110123 [Paenibacillus sp. OV219]